MAHVNSLKSIWEKTDSSYIQAAKPGGRTPVCRRLFPQAESNLPAKNQQNEDNDSGTESEAASECSSNSKAFAAIPEEFRPSRRGRGLMKVKSSPPSIVKGSVQETPQNEGFRGRTKKGDAKSPISPTIQNENRIQKIDPFRAKQSEQPQRDNGLKTDDTGKEKELSEMFFYSPQNEADLKPSNGLKNSRESSELSNLHDENNHKEFYNPDKESKTTNECYGPFFGQHNQGTDFDKCSNNVPSTGRNTMNQNKGKGGTNSPKPNQSVPTEYQDRSLRNQIKTSPSDKGAQKVKREVTVEKRIKWENDLCEFKKPENKPKFFYKYTKTTTESVSYVPSDNENDNDDDKITKKPYQDFRRGREICENFRRRNFGDHNERAEDPKDKRFDSTPKDQRNETKPLSQQRPQIPVNKCEENQICFQCGNGKEPIVVKHEIKVIHEHRQGRSNQMFRNSPQNFRPPNKDRNGKMFNFDNRERNGKMTNSDSRERNGRMMNTDARERSGRKMNNDSGERNGRRMNNDSRERNSRMMNTGSSEINGRMLNTDYRERNGKMMNTDASERNGKMINIDSRERNGRMMNTGTSERNGRIINTYTKKYCTAQITKNTMTKTTEAVQQTRWSSGWSSKSDCQKNTVPRRINNEKAAALIKYGREISDLIDGSYLAINTFLENYKQWKDLRRVTMLLFEEVEKNLSQSHNRNKRVAEIAELVGSGCKMVQFAPHVGVSIASKVIAVLSGVVAKMFSSNSAKSVGIDDFQLKLGLQRDMEATEDIYASGQQCDFQFEETRKLIEKFHRDVQEGRFKEFQEAFETGFLRELSLLNPKLPEVFYKKLGRIYKILNEQQHSEEDVAFCEGLWPEALAIVGHLYRRFKAENWNSSSVMKTWEEIYNLLQNDQTIVEDLLKKIQDCICLLIREQSIMEKYAMELQREV